MGNPSHQRVKNVWRGPSTTPVREIDRLQEIFGGRLVIFNGPHAGPCILPQCQSDAARLKQILAESDFMTQRTKKA